MREKLKKVLMVAILVARNENEDMVAPMLRSDRMYVLLEFGAWSQTLGWYVGRREKSHLIYLKKRRYKFCAFSAI
jgi:hypothetical protein